MSMPPSIRLEFTQKHPDFPWLDASPSQPLSDVLTRAGVIKQGEQVIRVEKAGQGNMNLTLRVWLNHDRHSRTVIVKQSRPWVEKYDFIPAPWDRALVEAAFYQSVRHHPEIQSQMPRFLGVDEPSRTLVLEDLGEGRDLSSAYQTHHVGENDIATVARYLRALHDTDYADTSMLLTNQAMRELNHAYIFDLPLKSIDLPALDKFEVGLGAAAKRLTGDVAYCKAVKQTGDRYLASRFADAGACLLHGDCFPGSWISTPRGLFVIDPEFCFFGDPEFDVGVVIAHLALARCDIAHARSLVANYARPLDPNRLSAYAAIEVMRRLIGVAQLPLPSDKPFRVELLLRSHAAMLNHKWELLWN